MTKHETRPLTESDYNRRVARLERQLRDAKTANEEAQLKFVQGDIDKAEAEAASSEVVTIDKQLVDLHAAWAASERIGVLEAVAVDAAARRADVEQGEALEGERAKHLAAVEAACLALAEPLKRIREIDAEITSLFRPHSRAMDMEFALFASLARATDRETRMLKGALAKAGLADFGVFEASDAFLLDSNRAKSISEGSRGVVIRQFRSILGDD